MATILTLRYPKWTVAVPLLTWAAMASYGRIYLGLHYPGDVLGGMIIGAGCSTLTYCFREDLVKLRHTIFGEKLFLSVEPYPDGGGIQLTYRL